MSLGHGALHGPTPVACFFRPWLWSFLHVICPQVAREERAGYVRSIGCDNGPALGSGCDLGEAILLCLEHDGIGQQTALHLLARHVLPLRKDEDAVEQ